jgi:predicted DNA-binding mobile mystery protein A
MTLQFSSGYSLIFYLLLSGYSLIFTGNLSGYSLMKNIQKLQIEQLDRKLAGLANLPEAPTKGWVHAIRTALKMSFRQFGARLDITAQSAQEIEAREKNGTITLKNLHEVARAMNMKLVYGFVPAENTFENMLDKQALAVARKIVMRTDNTMKLEDQQVSKDRVEKAVRELADEIKREMPRYLWD